MFENHVLDLYYYSDKARLEIKPIEKAIEPFVEHFVKPTKEEEVPEIKEEVKVFVPKKIMIISAIQGSGKEVVFKYGDVLCKWCDGDIIQNRDACIEMYEVDKVRLMIEDIIPTLTFININ